MIRPVGPGMINGERHLDATLIDPASRLDWCMNKSLTSETKDWESRTDTVIVHMFLMHRYLVQVRELNRIRPVYLGYVWLHGPQALLTLSRMINTASPRFLPLLLLQSLSAPIILSRTPLIIPSPPHPCASFLHAPHPTPPMPSLHSRYRPSVV